jgi:hypothetical protein
MNEIIEIAVSIASLRFCLILKTIWEWVGFLFHEALWFELMIERSLFFTLQSTG